MITKRTPQAVSLLALWLFYLENSHSKTIDFDLKRVSQVAARLGVLKPTPFVFTVASTNGKGTTCRTLESILVAARYKVGVYGSSHLMCYTECIRVQGQELPESAYIASSAEIESACGDISLTHFECDTPPALWLFRQAQLDVVVLRVGLGGHLDAANIVSTDVAVVTSIALDHTGWLGPDRGSIGREKTDIFRSEKPTTAGKPEMPSTATDVVQEKGTLLQHRDVEWNYSVTDHDWAFSDTHGTLENLPLPLVPQPNAVTALAVLCVSGLEVSEDTIRDGIVSAILPGRFQIVSELPCAIFDVAHSLHAAEYLTGRMEVLPKNGRVLAVIDMPHDKDIAGTLAWPKGVIDD